MAKLSAAAYACPIRAEKLRQAALKRWSDADWRAKQKWLLPTRSQFSGHESRLLRAVHTLLHRALRNRRIRESGIPRYSDRMKMWRQLNAEHCRSYSREYYHAHRERILRQKKIDRQEQPEKFRTLDKAQYKKHRDKIKEKNKMWRKTLHAKFLIRASRGRDRENLIPSIVKRALTRNTDLMVNEIPAELVAAKRRQIQLTRLLRRK